MNQDITHHRINKTRVYANTNRYAAMATMCMAMVLVKDAFDVRDRLPEPIDVFDHVGNVNGSAQIGYVAALLSGVYLAGKNPDTSVGLLRAKMASVGLVAGLAVNALIETKTGMNIIGWQNTPDIVDAAYGIGAATAAATVVPGVKKIETMQ